MAAGRDETTGLSAEASPRETSNNSEPHQHRPTSTEATFLTTREGIINSLLREGTHRTHNLLEWTCWGDKCGHLYRLWWGRSVSSGQVIYEKYGCLMSSFPLASVYCTSI